MSHHHHDSKRISIAFFLNLAFTIIEIIGGLYTNSLAILSDALHDLGDSISLGLSWYLQKVSQKGRSDSYSYGYRRFSLLGAVISSIVLITGSVFILIRAVGGLFSPQSVDAKGMILLAVLGVLFNGIAVLRMRGGNSMNEKLVTWHLMEDALGWIAVLVGSILIYFFDLPIIDPILSILITLFVLYNVVRYLKKSSTIFLQGIPQNARTSEINQCLVQLEEIESVHDIHLWSMDGDYNILTLHVVLGSDYTLKKQIGIKKKIRENLLQFNISHLTIEMETLEEHCELVDC